MTVLLINEKRHLLNDENPAFESMCDEIIKSYPPDSTVEFVKPVLGLDYRAV